MSIAGIINQTYANITPSIYRHSALEISLCPIINIKLPFIIINNVDMIRYQSCNTLKHNINTRFFIHFDVICMQVLFDNSFRHILYT